VRFEVGASSGVLCQCQIEMLGEGFLDFSVSHFFCHSFWLVSIAVEVHQTYRL